MKIHLLLLLLESKKQIILLLLLKQDQDADYQLHPFLSTDEFKIDPIYYATIEGILSTQPALDEVNTIDAAHNGRNSVRNIPGYATRIEAEALDWWNANLSDAEVDAIGYLSQAQESEHYNPSACADGDVYT